MQKTKQTLEDIKANGYNIDFGHVFNDAFENYKKIALNAGVATLLMTLMLCIIFGIVVVAVIGSALSADSMAQLRVENMSPLWIVGYLFMLILVCAIASPLNAGLLKMAQSAFRGESFSVGTAFEYYKSIYFKDILVATLLISFVSTTLSLGLQLAGYQFIGVLISAALSIFTFLVIPLIIFGNLNAMQAIEGSILIVSKQFLIVFALLIVSIIMVMLGFFGFCIGVFFTIPFLYSMYYTIYRHVMGDETAEISSDIPSTE